MPLIALQGPADTTAWRSALDARMFRLAGKHLEGLRKRSVEVEEEEIMWCLTDRFRGVYSPVELDIGFLLPNGASSTSRIAGSAISLRKGLAM